MAQVGHFYFGAVGQFYIGANSFNPRAREGATDADLKHIPKPEVSIHAPVRARPRQADQAAELEQVSIHAPVRARPPAPALYARRKHLFQSTRP
ncbi:conserved hypothetical protein [Xanthomonas citri pv. citri]|nr:conserved hypothetical protein [Xanthomonas citri pv. citri]